MIEFFKRIYRNFVKKYRLRRMINSISKNDEEYANYHLTKYIKLQLKLKGLNDNVNKRKT